MKVVDERKKAMKHLEHKLRTLMASFEDDCDLAFTGASNWLCEYEVNAMADYLDSMQNFNANAPVLKWNGANDYIEVHYPNDDCEDVYEMPLEKYNEVAINLKEEKIDLPRKIAFYMQEMLNVARGLNKLAVVGELKDLKPLVDELMFLAERIEMFYYLVFYLLPWYRDNITLQTN